MKPMDEAGSLDFVNAGAAALGIHLDEARAQRVAGHLQRTAALAHLLDQFALEVHDEPAEVYCPMRRS